SIMSGITTSYSAKVVTWLASITSPSSTHASSMLIILGLFATVTAAAADTAEQAVKEPIRAHHPKISASSEASDAGKQSTQDGHEVKQLNNQDMIYYVAMGMLCSQGLIRLFSWLSSRRETAAVAARKKDDDLAQGTGTATKRRNGGLSLNALEDLEQEELLKQQRREHLASLGESAELFGSDSDDEDYEVEEEEEESSDEELESDAEESMDIVGASESENEFERRRRILVAGDAEIEE
ncbi:hypothetical protein BGW38_005194, partial [Lunasporangiospora selenospora]